MNLYQKIVEVRKEAKGFYKDKKSFNYAYVTGNQILEKIRDKMNELNLLLIPSTKLGEHYTHNYLTAKGKDATDFVVSGEMAYTWVDGDNPEEKLEVSWAYYGQQDDISKAYGSALTYSERYFLLKCLGLPTDEDDPDLKPQRQQPVKQPPKVVEKTGRDKHLDELYELVKVKKFEKSIKDYIKKTYNKDSSKELIDKEINELIELLKAMG